MFLRVLFPSVNFAHLHLLQKIGIGIDQLPDEIRRSKVLTGNDLAMLAGVEAIPGASRAFTLDEKKHQEAKELLKNANVEEAWRILSMPD